MKININSKKNNISGFYYTVDVEENENGREMNNSEYVERAKNMNYIIAVNKNNKFPIILDYETNDKDCCPEVGYITEFEDWETQVKEYMNNYMECYFDGEKVLSESGIYKIEGYWEENDTPDGLFETYWVTKVTKIEELPY